MKIQEVTIKVQGDTGTTHTVTKGRDGAWMCGCAAWRFQKVNGANRTCKHINFVVLDMGRHAQKALATAAHGG